MDIDVAPLCKCGCGQRVRKNADGKDWNTYLQGHWNRSPERREAMSERLLQHYEEHPEDAVRDPDVCSRSSREYWNDPKNKLTESQRMKKQWEDPQERELQKRKMLTFYEEHPEVAEVDRARARKYYEDHPEEKKAFGERMREFWSDPERREVKKKEMLRYYEEHPEKREEERQRGLKHWNDLERLEVEKQRMEGAWKDSVYVEKTLDGLGHSPNKLELYFDELTPDYVRFVGDGSWWRTLPNGKHKNPDFKVKGQKKVIEIHGDHWHEGEDVTVLMEMFHRIGYECLIIWEKDLREDPDQVVTLVTKFCGGN